MTKGKIPKPPKRCPCMKDCTMRLDWNTFSFLCDTDAWVCCNSKRAKKKAKKYLRKPAMWKLLKEVGDLDKEE